MCTRHCLFRCMCRSSCDAVPSPRVPLTGAAWLDQSADTERDRWDISGKWMYINVLGNATEECMIIIIIVVADTWIVHVCDTCTWLWQLLCMCSYCSRVFSFAFIFAVFFSLQSNSLCVSLVVLTHVFKLKHIIFTSLFCRGILWSL